MVVLRSIKISLYMILLNSKIYLIETMSLWGRNNGKWASYQIQQNQNRSIYADHVIQQERITQGCQTINKSNNVASVNSGSVLTALKEGSQDYTCTEQAECLVRNRCPVPTVTPPAPYVAGPGQAVWANMLTTNSSTSTNTFSLRSVYTDISGNVYVIGFGNDSAPPVNIPIYDYITTTNGQVILRESTTVPPINFVDIPFSKTILIKYNKDGIAQWAVNFDGEESSGFGVVCDNSGNVYISSRAYGATPTPPTNPPINIYHMDASGNRILYGTVTYSLVASYDIMIIKYNSNGTAQAVSLCGNVVSVNENISTSTTPIAIDPSGNISYIFYTGGNVNIYHGIQPVSGILNFNTTPFRTLFKSGAQQLGILVRADSNLQIQQVTKITGSTGTGSDTGNINVFISSVCMDISGNTIVCGYYVNTSTTTVNFLRVWNNTGLSVIGTYNGGGGSMNVNIANSFIIKYDSTLSFVGLTAITSTAQNEIGQNITVDGSGNIYSTVNLTVTNTTSSIQSYGSIVTTVITTTTFSTITTTTGPIVLIIKYTPNLVVIPNFVTYIEPTITSVIRPNVISSYGITLDANNNIYIGVVFNGGTMTINNSLTAPLGGPITVSPYARVTNITPVITSTLYNNGVIIKYNSNFQGQWATTLNCGINIAVSPLSLFYDAVTNSVYTAGVFSNYYGDLNIQNFNRITGGNLVTDFYAKMTTNAIGLSTGQTTGYVIRYAA